MLCQILGHGSDSGSDFQNAVVLCNTSGIYDLIQYMAVDQEVLSEPLLKCKLVFLNGFYGLLRVY